MRTMLMAATFVGVLLVGLLPLAASALRSVEIRNAERGISRSGILKIGDMRLEREQIFECNVTLLMTLNRVIPKREGAVIGKATGIAIDLGTPAVTHCRKERETFFTEIRNFEALNREGHEGTHSELGNGIQLYDLTGGEARSWNMVYESILGTLPSITGIGWHLERVLFLIKARFIFIDSRCLYNGNVFGLTEVRAGAVSTSRILLERSILNTGEAAPCPARVSVSGTFTSTPPLTVALL